MYLKLGINASSLKSSCKRNTPKFVNSETEIKGEQRHLNKVL